ncbi:MAG TPA: hypothetical protein VNR51_05840 [Hyphomicrobium sp.]|nr:hypothetical protein [Hyphomicrobium sp.]
MADKSSFTPEEWKTILASPMLAGLAVTLAEPSGLWGTLKESMASAQALLAAGNDPQASPLMKALLADIETSDGRTVAREEVRIDLTGKSPADLKEQVMAKLAKVGEILDAKAPGDAAAFKTWLKYVADQVAEAASEGGVLGFGGQQVTDAERATVSEVGRALKVA